MLDIVICHSNYLLPSDLIIVMCIATLLAFACRHRSGARRVRHITQTAQLFSVNVLVFLNVVAS
jgi:hypothetical protein